MLSVKLFLCPCFNLHPESQRLQQDLEKVQQLEGKITGELSSLKERVSTMESELTTYRDLDTLRHTAEEKKKVPQSVLQRCAAVRHIEKSVAPSWLHTALHYRNFLAYFICSHRYQPHQLTFNIYMLLIKTVFSCTKCGFRLSERMFFLCRDWRRSACH